MNAFEHDGVEENVEHERRFLVTEKGITDGHEWVEISQAYIWKGGGGAMRVRLTQGRGANGALEEGVFLLTFKGPKNDRGSRFEKEIQYDEDVVQFIMEHAKHIVTKRRYSIVSEGNAFEVDQFTGMNEGLVIAEFEASADDVARLRRPWWCGDEVTADQRYNNENLATEPWQAWPERREV